MTKIEWTDATWNPVRGCSMAKGSGAGGCLNCYAARMAARNMPEHRSPTTGEPFAVMRGAGPRWTGKVELIPGKLAGPLHWRKPRRCFVNSMSDLFHESLPFEQIAAVFGVMAACPHITFQVLTKRPEVATEFYRWLSHDDCPGGVMHAALAPLLADLEPEEYIDGEEPAIVRLHERVCEDLCELDSWPLPNLHLGISAENQQTFDARWLHLRECPAAVRVWSYEPALGPVDPGSALGPDFVAHWRESDLAPSTSVPPSQEAQRAVATLARAAAEQHGEIYLDWVIAGGESGPGARPPHPDWFRSVRDRCVAAGVPFFFKHWGEWTPDRSIANPVKLTKSRWNHKSAALFPDGTHYNARFGHPDHRPGEPFEMLWRVGKRKTGRLLDGRTWDEFPEARHG